MKSLFTFTVKPKKNIRNDPSMSIAGVPVINSLQLVKGVHVPVHIVFRLPSKAVEGMLISNIGGRKDRSIIVPAGMFPGDLVIVAAIP